MGAILDGPLPGLRSEAFAGSEVLPANELAERVRAMSGKALPERHNAAVTPYGRLQRRDGQPIQAMEQEPGTGGMEGMS